MSHFSVMVIIPKGTEEHMEDYLTKVLENYNENKEVEPYIYIPAEELTKEYLKNKDEFGYTSLEDFAKKHYGLEIDKEGNLISTRNPQGKWDWWEIGGRWTNLLLLKDGNEAEFGKIRNIDFQGIEERNIQERKSIWQKYINSKGTKDDKLLKFIYGIRKDDTEKTFIERGTKFNTFSVIDKEGKWHERATMGWFGMDDGTEEQEREWESNFYKNFIEPLDEEDGIVIVDCHI